jgi:glycosyltransferase involved in cell wall biosynthesis
VADLNLRRQARAATAVITQTPISRAIIESYTQAPVFVVPNGADGDLFNPAVAPAPLPGVDEGRIVIAFAGSLRPWHGVEDLIAAGEEVLRKRPEAFFLIVGGGGREAALRRMAQRSLGAANYLFTGSVAPADVPSYLARAHVLAAPFAPGRDSLRRRQFEKYGMWWSPVKIFEYMAMGRAIVASAAGMTPEYLAGVAVTYAPGDVDALSEALLRLAENAAARRALGAAARDAFLQNYTWRHAAQRTVAAWQEAIGARRKVVLAP